MSFGEPGTEGARVNKLQDVEGLLDLFRKQGHREVTTLPRCFNFSVERNWRSIRRASMYTGSQRSYRWEIQLAREWNPDGDENSSPLPGECIRV
jgi:hypothetical protein